MPTPPPYTHTLQAMARVHRIGQTKPVHVYRLVTQVTLSALATLQPPRRDVQSVCALGGGCHAVQPARPGPLILRC